MAFSTEDRQLIRTLAQQHGISEGAVEALWLAVQAGNGTAAQFNHPELGGMGQWMAGGMVMVGDFNNSHLQSIVRQICIAIAAHLQTQRFATQSTAANLSAQSQMQGQASSGGFQAAQPTMQTQPERAATNQPSTGKGNGGKGNGSKGNGGKSGGLLSTIGKKLFGGSDSSAERATASTASSASSARDWSNWWPDELGSPNSSGSQNEMHYAYFAGTQRLALRLGNRVTIYATGEHQINGVSQQQDRGQTVIFRSQRGELAVDKLKKLRDYTL